MFRKMKEPLKSCFIIVIVLYGAFYISAELFLRWLPYGLLCALAMYLALCMLRIQPPQPHQAEAIVGEDLWIESEEGDDNSSFYLKTVAHRGAGLDAPENSLEAFKLACKFENKCFSLLLLFAFQCAEKRCQCIEFDVVLTADGVPIVFHDRTLERMTNSEKRISRHVWEEIAGCDISAKHPLK